jgi:MAE_28990/MAE_18760-like HEPN
MNPLDLLSKDLDWREAELGSLKLLLARADTTDHQKLVLLRSCWALLYAHYEGFVKTALTIFYSEASKRVADCGSLPEGTKIFALANSLRKMRSHSDTELLKEIEGFAVKFINQKPGFPEVDTKSNLWPNVLEDLLSNADLALNTLEQNRIRLRTLVARRNDIAHGKNELIKEVDYYRQYEASVYDVMYELAFCVDDRLRRPPYI